MFRRSLSLLSGHAAKASHYTPTSPLFAEIAQNKPSYDDVVAARNKYLAPSLRTFQAYDTPLVLSSASMQYMYDIQVGGRAASARSAKRRVLTPGRRQGRRYVDLLGQNLCISVGHRHPKVTAAAVDQMNTLPHCTTMYYHEQPSMYAKELVQRLPPHPSGEDWVVHLVCTGSEGRRSRRADGARLHRPTRGDWPAQGAVWRFGCRSGCVGR